jgi:hypothetical protein
MGSTTARRRGAVSLDGPPADHVRVLLDGLPVFERHGLLLAGGYTFRAHEILHRRHEPELDLETILDHLAGVNVSPMRRHQPNPWTKKPERPV